MSISWSGEGWQQYCEQLFALRHGVDYQSIPDGVRGDWGIEGFSGSGVLYQCYAPEEPLTRKDLSEKLRTKLTVDLGKLAVNIDDIRLLVDPALITHWVLVVPRVEDKAVIAHAAKKAELFRAQSHPGVAAGFIVRVCTAEDFPEERRRIGSAESLILPQVGAANDDSVTDFAPVEVRTPKHERLMGDFIKYYLDGQAFERVLQESYPTIYERWRRARFGVSRELAITDITAPTGPGQRVADIKSKLSDSAVREIPLIGETKADMLAYGTVAEWLLECPLDFTAEHAR